MFQVVDLVCLLLDDQLVSIQNILVVEHTSGETLSLRDQVVQGTSVVVKYFMRKRVVLVHLTLKTVVAVRSAVNRLSEGVDCICVVQETRVEVVQVVLGRRVE